MLLSSQVFAICKSHLKFYVIRSRNQLSNLLYGFSLSLENRIQLVLWIERTKLTDHIVIIFLVISFHWIRLLLLNCCHLPSVICRSSPVACMCLCLRFPYGDLSPCPPMYNIPRWIIYLLYSFIHYRIYHLHINICFALLFDMIQSRHAQAT